MADAQTNKAPQLRAVTISREYGSGGGEIAVRLADRLGWKLVDHEVVVQVAHALGITEEEAEAYDEHADSVVSRLLASLTMIQPAMPVAVPVQFTTDSPQYGQAVRKVVQAAYNTGNVVIVGRGAQVLLAGQRDVLHARIIAPVEKRIAYVMQRERLDHSDAQARINFKDRDRAHFLFATHHRDPADAHLYDVVINTGVLDLDGAVELLSLAVERKAGRLSAPAEELGPAAGLTAYPEPPGNFTAGTGDR